MRARPGELVVVSTKPTAGEITCVPLMAHRER